MLGAALPHYGPHGIYIVMRGLHHLVIPVEDHLRTLCAQVRALLCQVVLLVRIFLYIEQHFLRKQMIPAVYGSDIYIVIKPGSSLAHMGTLGQNRIGLGAVCAIL